MIEAETNNPVIIDFGESEICTDGTRKKVLFQGKMVSTKVINP